MGRNSSCRKPVVDDCFKMMLSLFPSSVFSVGFCIFSRCWMFASLALSGIAWAGSERLLNFFHRRKGNGFSFTGMCFLKKFRGLNVQKFGLIRQWVFDKRSFSMINFSVLMLCALWELWDMHFFCPNIVQCGNFESKFLNGEANTKTSWDEFSKPLSSCSWSSVLITLCQSSILFNPDAHCFAWALILTQTSIASRMLSSKSCLPLGSQFTLLFCTV